MNRAADTGVNDCTSLLRDSESTQGYFTAESDCRINKVMTYRYESRYEKPKRAPVYEVY